MSNETSTHGGTAGTARARPARLSGAGRRGLLGLPEIIALACATLLLLTALAAYFLLLRPARRHLQAQEAERVTLETRINAARGEFSEKRDTQTSVREILASLENFEINHLGVSGDGGTRVYEELHTLMLKNNLRLSGGASYTQLQETAPEEAGRRQGQRAAGGMRVVQSIFPGIGVTLTVEGTYPNLRRFVRAVEASRQFVVINTVELEGVSDGGRARAALPPEGEDVGVTQGSRLVSLRLDMAAYFRRTGTITARQ